VARSALRNVRVLLIASWSIVSSRPVFHPFAETVLARARTECLTNWTSKSICRRVRADCFVCLVIMRRHIVLIMHSFFPPLVCNVVIDLVYCIWASMFLLYFVFGPSLHFFFIAVMEDILVILFFFVIFFLSQGTFRLVFGLCYLQYFVLVVLNHDLSV
jgi:hypothetical protein